MTDSRGSKGLNVLRTLYLIGAVIAVLVIISNLGQYPGQQASHVAYSVLFLLWGGLIWASAYLAFRSGSRRIWPSGVHH